MSRLTPTPNQSRDTYQRPGQRSTSTEKARRAGEDSRFFTNLTSVNIATAFARAHITADTIRRRPAHLKGSPMSPSQIPRMNLADLPDARPGFGQGPLDADAHFESSAAPRSHGVRPVRDITAQGAGGLLPDGFLRERPWGQPTTAAPGWFRKVQDQRNPPASARDLMAESPPPGLIDTPSNGLGRTAAAPRLNPFTDNLIDLQTPHAAAPWARPDNLYARSGAGRAYTNGDRQDEPTHMPGDNMADIPGGLIRSTRPRSKSRLSAYAGHHSDDAAPLEARDNSGRTPRPESRYSLRSRISTPGRLSYDHEFNPHDEGHVEHLRSDPDSVSRRPMNMPTPYTARIRGPGAFPATAQRYSRRRPSSHDAADSGADVSPTDPRRPAPRTASGNAALTEADLLSTHRYLDHGAAPRQGWDEYTRADAAERESVHSFSDSFISNSTAADRDNPTLLKRLLRNIAAGWSGSSGSLAERLSFIFLMVYFLIKELCTMLATFLFRLVFNLVLGPLYTGIREVVLLPSSLFRVLTPSSSHDAAGTMRGILTGLTMLAISVVVAQYGQPALSGLADLPRSLAAGSWRPKASMPANLPESLDPLTDEEIERMGGRGSVVVDRLVSVEQTLQSLYSVLDSLKTHQEDETQDVRETLKRLQQERQALLDTNRSEQQRIDSLEREYSSIKRDLSASAVRSSEGSKLKADLQDLKKRVEKLAKSSPGKGKDAGAKLDEVRRLIDSALAAQERELKALLKPEWLTTDGDAAYANVARMIEEALNRYTNDRLGKTDFALFSAGARIVPGLTSPTFEPPARGLMQRFWRTIGMVSSQPPTTILDPGTHVGECWPMQGSRGQVAIHLSQPVEVSEFAIEHVARSIAIDWRSAPRQIEIWGYVLDADDASDRVAGDTQTAPLSVRPDEPESAETPAARDGNGAEAAPAHHMASADTRGEPAAPPEHGIANPPFAESNTKYGLGRLELLVSHEYAPSDTSALQIFRLDRAVRMRTAILKINTNWGHPEHTCLYRFRMHGHPASS
ncbi:hypothetical protein GGF46_003560 [Coemansia sp. RSA 552]|nr:hypothetical protein GGF46_003560 [Coemansia sp. RSA 552]